MIDDLIYELVLYAEKNELVAEEDEVCVINNLLSLFERDDYFPRNKVSEPRGIHEILEDMLAYAIDSGILNEPTNTEKDLFDTKIMGAVTPLPSVVRTRFKELYSLSPEEATDDYYRFSKATNYIREDRIKKDEKWTVESEFGKIDITINLSKPEKDPRDIALAGKIKKSAYPACQLCKENEGYAGTLSHPARQNHRIIPLSLFGENYYLQYSPYVYYNEHCIVFNEKHVPMVINRATFEKLLDFVSQFPHYTVGSNADLPIVGGSILSHDHFQGGRYVFAMARAEYDKEFTLEKYPNVTAGILNWPMSVIRLSCCEAEELVAAADTVLTKWRAYSDESAFIFAETDGVPHNTVTPIARKRNGKFELDLVLRNNITTEENPLGFFHPHAQLHHIKKENIGLIEVMGLAVLPARLKKEMHALETALLNGENLRENELTASHADWAEEWASQYELNEENIHGIVQVEIGKVFVEVLKDAGVFKRTKEGMEAFDRFVNTLDD